MIGILFTQRTMAIHYIGYVLVVHNCVAMKYGSGLPSPPLPCELLGDMPATHVASSGSTQIVKTQSRQACRWTCTNTSANALISLADAAVENGGNFGDGSLLGAEHFRVSLLVMFCRFVLAICLLSAALSLANRANAQQARHSDSYRIVHAYPHDPDAFTQGLVYVDGHLYESTGRNGKSSIRMVDLTTGRVLQRYDLPAKYFGEGLTSWGSNLIQLTWKAETGFVYDRFSFAPKRIFHYPGEGWGLTHDAKDLILSDGTPVLRFIDPRSLSEIKRISVRDEQRHPVSNINELEYVHGEIYANVWQTDKIVRISSRTGKILGWIDLSGLMDKSQLPDPESVLNGIAYDAKMDRLFVTGKLWPKLFEIKVVHQPSGSRQKNHGHPPQ